MLKRGALLLLVLAALTGCTKAEPLSESPIQGRGLVVNVDAYALDVALDQQWDSASRKMVMAEKSRLVRVTLTDKTVWLTSTTPTSYFVRNFITMHVQEGQTVVVGGYPKPNRPDEIALTFVGPAR